MKGRGIFKAFDGGHLDAAIFGAFSSKTRKIARRPAEDDRQARSQRRRDGTPGGRPDEGRDRAGRPETGPDA